MDQQTENKEYLLRKRTMNPNIKVPVVLSHHTTSKNTNHDNNEVILISGNTLILYNINTNFITNRFIVSDCDLKKFFLIDNSRIIVLDKKEHLILYNLETKETIKSISVNTSNIVKPKDKDTILAISENSINVYDVNLHHKDTIRIDGLEKDLTTLDVNNDASFLAVLRKNQLILINLLSHSKKLIEFKRTLTVLKFVNSSNLVVGDYSGKLHFIYDIDKEEVNFIF